MSGSIITGLGRGKDVNTMNGTLKWTLTFTEASMLAYWLFATLVVLDIISVPPEYMYSDYRNPLIVIWNWSFFPIDVLFAITGLVSRFASLSLRKAEALSIVSLSLMFCAGLMALSFWAIQQSFDPFWWGLNLWLVVLPSLVLTKKLLKGETC